MAALLTDQTSDTTGTGAVFATPVTVFVYGTFDGATALIEVSHDDTTYVPFGEESQIQSARAIGVSGQGTYYVRASIVNSGPATSLSVDTTP